MELLRNWRRNLWGVVLMDWPFRFWLDIAATWYGLPLALARDAMLIAEMQRRATARDNERGERRLSYFR